MIIERGSTLRIYGEMGKSIKVRDGDVQSARQGIGSGSGEGEIGDRFWKWGTYSSSARCL
jgi:hypothetical protein